MRKRRKRGRGDGKYLKMFFWCFDRLSMREGGGWREGEEHGALREGAGEEGEDKGGGGGVGGRGRG